MNKLVKEKESWQSFTFRFTKKNESFIITSYSIKEMEKELIDKCLYLVEENVKEYYIKSGWGWDKDKKCIENWFIWR